jgi:hypothetical protein
MKWMHKCLKFSKQFQTNSQANVQKCRVGLLFRNQSMLFNVLQI